MNKQFTIGFIGGGNMASAIIRGLLAQKISPESIHVADPSADQRQALKVINPELNRYQDGSEIPADVDAVVLAVKPQIMATVVMPLVRKFKPETLVISIAAGVPMQKLADWFGPKRSIVRCMPNTPALVGLGTSGLYAAAQVTQTQRELTEAIFNSVGISFWLDQESDIDSVIAVSGSGPAYFFYLMECMQKTALELGLAPEVAEKITIQTALGAATLASTSQDTPATLRQNVTSKGGTTEAAINHMQAQKLPTTIQQAMHAAVNRATALSNQDQ